jgi:hypothetical protein
MLWMIALVVCVIPVLGLAPVTAQSAAPDADVIVTAALVYAPLAALKSGERFPKGAQLLLIHAGKAGPLVAGFAATADANVSFDGERVLFAGKQATSDSWQIFELTLKDRSVRKLTAGESDAIRPFYLPEGRMVYARRTALGFRLEAAGKDGALLDAPMDAQAGATVLPLSYVPGSAIPADVLLDGRILFESGFPLGSGSTPELYLVYSDGSGVESYRCDHGRARWGGKQLASGDVVFTHGASLARFTSPLAHEVAVVAPKAEYAGAVAETASGAWLVSARAAGEKHYALKLWKQELGKNAQVMKAFFAASGEDVLEPVVVAPRTRPKRHPSGLHPWDYANMMALDARISREGDLKIAPAQVRLETLNAAGRAVVAGTAPVEADGSFLVKTPADKPIRFALLDAKGAVVRQERGWFWIRRGEQRYCVGCHAGPERSPENKLPAVLKRTTTPADLTGMMDAGAAQQTPARGN